MILYYLNILGKTNKYLVLKISSKKFFKNRLQIRLICIVIHVNN